MSSASKMDTNAVFEMFETTNEARAENKTCFDYALKGGVLFLKRNNQQKVR